MYSVVTLVTAKSQEISSSHRYIEAPYRVLFYIKMSVVMSKGPHKVLKLVCQAMVEIFANFVA